MGYSFSTVSGGVKITNTTGHYSVITNGQVKISLSHGKLMITQGHGLGQLVDITIQEIDNINGMPPAEVDDQILDQLMAVFPDALTAAGAISTVNNISPDSNHNVSITAADINAVATSQLTLTGEANKVPQLDNGGNLILQNQTVQGEYSAGAIFFSKSGGGWLDIDAEGLEIDLFGSSTTIHMGLDGIDAADQPISTSFTPTGANHLTNKSYVDAQISDLTSIVASDGKNAQEANINSPTFYAVPNSGMYRISSFIVLTRAATTSSTLPGCSVSYTEATTGVVVQDIVTLSANTNIVGLHSGGSVIISAQLGSNIGYTTSDYLSSGATTMQYSIHIKVEFLG